MNDIDYAGSRHRLSRSNSRFLVFRGLWTGGRTDGRTGRGDIGSHQSNTKMSKRHQGGIESILRQLGFCIFAF